MDYCNEDTKEIIHRVELTRPTKQELYGAMHDFAHVIADGRPARSLAGDSSDPKLSENFI
jgi:hypothetical protein